MPTSDAWSYLVRLLRARPRSEWEARGRLEARGFPTSEIDRAMSLAIEAGMLDDRAFARLWVIERAERRPLARAAVARELREKGIPQPIAESALAESYPPAKERELVWRLARSRMERLRGLEAEKRVRRTIGYLTRRGFSYNLARAAVAQIGREEEDG